MIEVCVLIFNLGKYIESKLFYFSKLIGIDDYNKYLNKCELYFGVLIGILHWN